ncbi:MAG: hypothetical protein RI955_1176 [Bacteroidota bacterium]
MRNKKLILCGGFELAKSHSISTQQSILINILRATTIWLKKLICGIFKLLFSPLDFLNQLFFFSNIILSLLKKDETKLIAYCTIIFNNTTF